MRRLHHRVNLIPVIAKADTMNDEEIADFKARVSFYGMLTAALP
jgi:septin 7